MAPSRSVVLVSLPVLSLAVAICGVIGGCSPNREGPAVASPGTTKDADSTATAAATAEIAVVAVRAGREASDAFITFLEPVVDVAIPARADGIVHQVRVREGDRVGAGAVLGRMEDEAQRLEVDYTEALAAQARAELARAEKGAAGSVVSLQSLDAARAKAQATHVDVELAKLDYQKRTLRSPVSGIVWQVRAEPHRLVRSGDILFRVTDPSRLRAELFLPASFHGRLHIGDSVQLIPTGDAGQGALPGRVRTVSPIVDPSTGRLRVVVEAESRGRALAGMTARARFDERVTGTAGSKGGVAGAGALLPRAAYLERTADGFFVWVIAEGVAHRRAVELGSGRPDGYEVLAGLSPGDLVCTTDGLPPAEGARVRARLVADAGAVSAVGQP